MGHIIRVLPQVSKGRIKPRETSFFAGAERHSRQLMAVHKKILLGAATFASAFLVPEAGGCSCFPVSMDTCDYFDAAPVVLRATAVSRYGECKESGREKKECSRVERCERQSCKHVVVEGPWAGWIS